KLHLLCSNDDLRPLLNFLYFKDGYVYATNAHICIRQKLFLHEFSEEEAQIIDGCLLHKSTFAEILRYNIVTITENGFECLKGDVKATFHFIKTSDNDLGQYPNVEAVLKEPIESIKNKDFMVKTIGMNLNYIDLINKAMIRDINSFQFYFSTQNRAILIKSSSEPIENQIALLMPTQVDN